MSSKLAKLKLFTLSCLLVVVRQNVLSKTFNYDDYSVFRFNPQTNDHLNDLLALKAQMSANDVDAQFWTEPVAVNQTVDILLAPSQENFMLETMPAIWKIPNKRLIDNLAKLIRETSPDISQMNRNFLSNSTLKAQMLSSEKYYRQFHTYAEMEEKLQDLANLDSRIKIDVIGKSTEGRNLYLVKVSNNHTAEKPVILIDAGHHAREWISHATSMYLIESLVNIDIPRMSPSSCWTTRCRVAATRKTKLNLDDYDYWFVPVINPDGYEYTIRTDRLWRKTRSSTACRNSEGVDPNRNYPFHWMEAGASMNSCSDIYAGSKPQSEPEVRALVKVLDSNKNKIAMYISLHSYSQVILSPYGYGRVYPENYEDLKRVANSWIRTMSELRNTQYRFGTSAILLYPAAGGSDDYAYGAANIKYAYTIELPDTGRHGFVLPPSEIIPVGQEAVIGLKSMIDTMGMIANSTLS